MEDELAHAGAAALLAALRSEDFATRVRAACAVGDQLRFGKLVLSTALRTALQEIAANGEWHDLRFEAAITLCEAQDPAGAALAETLGNARRRFEALKALSRLQPDPALRGKVERIFGKWFLYWPDKLAAAAVLAKWGDGRGQNHFEEILLSPRGDRRALAVFLLGDLRLPNAFDRLKTIAEDATDVSCGAAVRALGHLNDPRAIAVLQTLPAELEEDAAYARALLS